MKKYIIPSLMGLALALFAVPSVFAHGQQQASATAKQPVNVTLWDIQTGLNQTMINTATQKFNQEHPNIHVVAEWFQNNPYKNKLRIALGAGNGPDIFYNWGGGPLHSFVKAGDAVSLTSYLNSHSSYKNKFPASVWGPVSFGGKVYGVPTQGMAAELLYYNKQMLDQYGLPQPTTFSNLMADVKGLRAHGIIPIGVAGKSEWPEMIWVQYLVDRIGGPSVFNAIANGKPGAWSNPAVIKALELCQELVKAHAFEPGFASVNASTSQVEALIAAKKAAMVAQGDWVYSTFLTDFNSFLKTGALAYAPMPAVNASYATQVVGAPSGYYSISNTSRHLNADMTYLQGADLNNYEVHFMIKKLGLVPPVKGVASLLNTGTPSGAFDGWLFKQISNAPQVQLYWDQYLPATTAKVMLTNISEIFLLQETPQQFAANMNQTLSNS